MKKKLKIKNKTFANIEEFANLIKGNGYLKWHNRSRSMFVKR